MLPTELADHRRSDEPTLVNALRARDPLALAEAYHRTVSAAYACARRLLSSPAQIEALLQMVYAEMWENPPEAIPLEGWIRARCFALATDDLRERKAAPAAPSAAAVLPDLPTPEVRYLDATERALAELDERARAVLLLAHDCGIDTETQGGDAAQVLDRALRALAGPDTSGSDASALSEDPCPDALRMGDWVLGLADEATATELEADVGTRPGCAARARALRRGRRRLEGLPPTPDMGQRVLVTVLSALPAAPPQPPLELSSASEEGEANEHAPWAGEAEDDHLEEQPPPYSQAEISTGELHLTELLRETFDEADPRAEREPEDPNATTTLDAPPSSKKWGRRQPVSVGARTHGTEARGTSMRAPRASGDPYAQLSGLDAALDEDIELPNPHRLHLARTTIPRTSAMGEFEADEFEADDDPEAFEPLYPEEELIARPSVGQRVLVAIGYVLPIVLGAVLGLYIAGLLFNP